MATPLPFNSFNTSSVHKSKMTSTSGVASRPSEGSDTGQQMRGDSAPLFSPRPPWNPKISLPPSSAYQPATSTSSEHPKPDSTATVDGVVAQTVLSNENEDRTANSNFASTQDDFKRKTPLFGQTQTPTSSLVRPMAQDQETTTIKPEPPGTSADNALIVTETIYNVHIQFSNQSASVARSYRSLELANTHAFAEVGRKYGNVMSTFMVKRVTNLEQLKASSANGVYWCLKEKGEIVIRVIEDDVWKMRVTVKAQELEI